MRLKVFLRITVFVEISYLIAQYIEYNFFCSIQQALKGMIACEQALFNSPSVRSFLALE